MPQKITYPIVPDLVGLASIVSVGKKNYAVNFFDVNTMRYESEHRSSIFDATLCKRSKDAALLRSLTDSYYECIKPAVLAGELGEVAEQMQMLRTCYSALSDKGERSEPFADFEPYSAGLLNTAARTIIMILNNLVPRIDSSRKMKELHRLTVRIAGAIDMYTEETIFSDHIQ